MKRLFILLVVSGCLQLPHLDAQSYIDIAGQVIDEVDGTPLAFAHVTILNGRLGTTTNSDGFFRLRISERYQADSLKVSYLSYRSKLLSVRDLSRGDNLIALGREGIDLQEIVVRPDNIDAAELVEAMRQQLRKNYPQKAKNIVGFFKETINLSTSNQQEILHAEGVLEFYKTAYRGNPDKRDAVRVVKGSRKPIFYGYQYGADTLSLPAISQGSHLGIMADIAKAPPDFLGPRFRKRYQYQHLGYTNIDTFSLHIISFKPLPGKQNGQLEGRLYIDTSSLALVKAAFIVTQPGLDSYNEYHTKVKELPINLISRKLEVNYSNHDGKWYLQSSHVRNRYTDVRTNMPFMNKMDVIITEIKPGKGKPLPPQEKVHRESVFAVHAGRLSADYWEGFNVIASTPLKTITTQPPTKKDLVNLEGTDWFTSLEVAKTLAKRENKLILVDFWAAWCGPCIKMDREVWSKPDIQTLKMNYIPVKIDVDINQPTARALNVKLLPTIMIIDPWEDTYLLEEGYKNKEQLKTLLKVFPTDMERLYLALEAGKGKEDPKHQIEVIRNLNLYASTRTGNAKIAFVKKSIRHLMKLRKVISQDMEPQLLAEVTWLDIWLAALRGQKARALNLLEEAMQAEIEQEHQALAYFLAVQIYREAGEKEKARSYLQQLKQSSRSQPYLAILTN